MSRLCGAGFTLIELLVVLGVIGLLASLLLPALSSAKGRASSVMCLSNVKQLQTAYHLYACDNNDAFIPNRSENIRLTQQNVAPSWVLGNAKDDLSPSNLQAGLLWWYLPDSKVFHCPSDHSTVTATRVARTRSYALSGWAGGTEVHGKGERFGSEGMPRKFSEIRERSLSEVFAFIDEHPDSIDDGVFAVYAHNHRIVAWKDLPSDRHQRGCNLSFMDGHADHWTWKAPKIFRDYDQRPANEDDRKDLLKVQDHLTAD